MKLFLGVDGGQTTTKVVLGNEQGELLAQATGGPSNHTEEPGGPERLEKVVRSTVGQALEFAGCPSLEEAEFSAACFGMTGETAIKHRVLQRIIRTLRLKVVHDSVNALAGATGGEAGVIVLSGTGSVARGRSLQGREVRVGGWAHLFGDEGSGYWIGREAVRAMLAESDRIGEATILTRLFLQRLKVSSAFELAAQYYSGAWSRDHLAGLAVWVNEAAEAGDQVAKRILRRAGKDLARFAIHVVDLLAAPTGPGEGERTDSGSPLVCYGGDVFQSRFVLSSFRRNILRRHPTAEIRSALLSPVLGSLLLAYRAAGIDVGKEVSESWSKQFGIMANGANLR